MTRSETVLQALLARLQTIVGPEVVRNDALTADVPAGGRIVLHDGEPGEPEITLSPHTWHFEHRAEVEIFAQDFAARDSIYDDLKSAVGAVLAADRTLGGTVDWCEPEAPRVTDLTFEGALSIKAGSIPVVLFYSTTDPLT